MREGKRADVLQLNAPHRIGTRDLLVYTRGQ